MRGPPDILKANFIARVKGGNARVADQVCLSRRVRMKGADLVFGINDDDHQRQVRRQRQDGLDARSRLAPSARRRGRGTRSWFQRSSSPKEIVRRTAAPCAGRGGGVAHRHGRRMGCMQAEQCRSASPRSRRSGQQATVGTCPGVSRPRVALPLTTAHQLPVDSGETSGILLGSNTRYGPGRMGACTRTTGPPTRTDCATRMARSVDGVTAGRRQGQAEQAVAGGIQSGFSRIQIAWCAGCWPTHPRVLQGPTCPSIPPRPTGQRQGPSPLLPRPAADDRQPATMLIRPLH